MDARPPVRCFVGKLDPLGQPHDVELVDLATAAQRHAEGWVVIGPDPQDEIALAQWYRRIDPGDADV